MPQYSIWIVENSCADTFDADATFSGYYRKGETMAFPQCMVIVKGEGHNILVDTGIDPNHPEVAAYCEMYGFKKAQTPARVLSKVGLKPEDIDTIFLTHAHWDHLGAVNCFPNARFYIQKKELFQWIEYCSLPDKYGFLSAATSIGLIADLIRKMAEHKVTLLDGDADNVLPGIHVRNAFNSHTMGSQLVLIDNDINGKKESYVAVGDVSYVKENVFGAPGMERFIPNGFASGDVYSIMKVMAKIIEYAENDNRRIMPIHDEFLWKKYPSVLGADGLHLAEVCLSGNEKSKL